jgi:hypothetical protein
VIVAIRATTGRFSLSTTALALMDLNVSGASCIANISRFVVGLNDVTLLSGRGMVASRQAREGCGML